MGASQVLWECSELEACEVYPYGVPNALKKDYKSKVSLITSSGERTDTATIKSITHQIEDELIDLWWDTIVYGYNTRILTKPKDKLIAICGIAKEVQRRLKQEYIAGLWSKNFVEQLNWYVPTSDSENNPPSWNVRARPQSYQAPSWSWAAINAPVRLPYHFWDVKPLAEILDYHLTIEGNEEFGPITDGYLRLRGQLVQATFVKDDEYLIKNWEKISVIALKGSSSIDSIVSAKLNPDIYVPIVSPETSRVCYPPRHAIGTRKFWLMPTVATTSTYLVGLILLRSGSGKRGEYQRCGMYHQSIEDPEVFDTWNNHVPSLTTDEYEEMKEGRYTITII